MKTHYGTHTFGVWRVQRMRIEIIAHVDVEDLAFLDRYASYYGANRAEAASRLLKDQIDYRKKILAHNTHLLYSEETCEVLR